MANPKNLTDWAELEKLLKEQESGKSTKIDREQFVAHLKSRVKGQDEIVEDVAELIRLNFAKEQRNKPICNLLFLGPTGTGKTELAKAIGVSRFGEPSEIAAAVAFLASPVCGYCHGALLDIDCGQTRTL